ncbi:Gfo/Idh/MocA family protein [Plantactinospora sp. GCM10030261]|uniref:Gfo/Idh/MocA family protein n=1 Tax=Plantactinospora sp. GCM10030261 TaxID=3273420 RepID=UPI00360C6188
MSGPGKDGAGRPGQGGIAAVPRVAVIGANGHGRWHRRAIAPMHAAGQARLVALVDIQPVEPDPAAAVPDEVSIFTDHREMLRSARPDVVVVCTPPHTHLPLALDVLAAGADLLLEKPPVVSMMEHRELAAMLDATGRACQVGFQALGSAALVELLTAVAAGRLGTVTGIGAVAAWQRGDAYYSRAPWAGRRLLNGRPVADGALANPLAHAVMQGLAVAAGVAGEPAVPVRVELERYRVRPIEVDDTATIRVTNRSGPPVLVAVTLAAEGFIAGEIVVRGTAGDAVLEYPTDRLWLPGEDALRPVPGRVGLLANLLAHRADPERVPLIAPLARTAGFTRVLEAVLGAPEPVLLGGDLVRHAGPRVDRVHMISGIDGLLRTAADRGRLLSELAVPWAVRPYRVSLAGRETAG